MYTLLTHCQNIIFCGYKSLVMLEKAESKILHAKGKVVLFLFFFLIFRFGPWSCLINGLILCFLHRYKMKCNFNGPFSQNLFFSHWEQSFAPRNTKNSRLGLYNIFWSLLKGIYQYLIPSLIYQVLKPKQTGNIWRAFSKTKQAI